MYCGPHIWTPCFANILNCGAFTREVRLRARNDEFLDRRLLCQVDGAVIRIGEDEFVVLIRIVGYCVSGFCSAVTGLGRFVSNGFIGPYCKYALYLGYDGSQEPVIIGMLQQGRVHRFSRHAKEKRRWPMFVRYQRSP